jgi:hypothetical protein
MQLVRSTLIVVLVSAFAAGCKQQSPMVYVLDGPQKVTLTVSASATKVAVGEKIVLHAQRHAVGKWKQIPRDQLTQGQCWLYTPPTELEEEVADNVEWQIEPENAMQLDATFQMDHTRPATVLIKGRITVRAFTAVRCEKDRIEEGNPIRIQVT